MKKLSLLLAFAAIPAFAGFKITKIEQDQAKVKLEFLTEESYNSICSLTVDSVKVTTPYSAYQSGLSATETGVIDVSVSTHPDTRCFRTPGVHSGKLELDKGEQVPRIKKGQTYKIVINGSLTREIEIK